MTLLKIEPARRVGPAGFAQQLRVVATFGDNKTLDVTHWAKFDSLDEGVVSVNADGLVTTTGKGQRAAMARFDGHAAIANFIVPFADAVDLAGWTDEHVIDRLAAAKFREIGITPSPLCDDAAFLRRAFPDVTGTLPTAEQAKAFLDSNDPAKRAKLVDRLLGLTGDPAQNVHDNDYAAYWALKWSDLIRSNSAAIGEQGMWALHNWLKESFRQNRPWDKMVRELVTVRDRSDITSGEVNHLTDRPP